MSINKTRGAVLLRTSHFVPRTCLQPTGQGTGLGLSLSYDVIKAHGGDLKVETLENNGSTFTIEIPYR